MAKSMLLHCCCAHCTAFVIEHWRRQGYEVSGLWYNPNIHPFSEHQRRLEAMQTLAREMDMSLEVVGGFDMPFYFRRVVGDEANRCRHCFDLRLSRTAEMARERSIDAFSTSLLISPHQQHETLRQVGDKIAGDVEFAYADLRKRYSESRHLTRGLDLYRQQYCGCLYSEWERYSGLKLAGIMNQI